MNNIYSSTWIRFCLIIPILYSLNVYSNNQYESKIFTSSGIIKGESKKGVIVWDDIPYALPPIKKLRWTAPKSFENFDNVIKPKKDNFCIQKPSGLGGSSGKGYFSGTEDCLYMDIKRPKKSLKNDLPVMFWIHGGGNTSGLKDVYDFSKLVKKHNIIVITINYRLGPFGWFTHPAIQDLQSGLDKTSNFGTLDIISALEWTKKNIHKFGGDPNNITVFGESAGGHNVYSLMVAKQAKGLFHKAISQSGYTTSITPKFSYKQNTNSSTSEHTSWNIVNKILAEQPKKINDDEKIAKSEIRKILKNLSSEDFFNHYSKRPSYKQIPLLVADGVVIPSVGLDQALSMEKFVNNVPIIAGTNKDEVKLWLATAEYFVELQFSFIGKILGIPKVKLKDANAFEIFNHYRSSAWKIRGLDIPLQNLRKAGVTNTYAYRFDWDDHRKFLVGDFKKLIGAAHATEIPLIAGDYKLVGGYPISGLIYPKGFSKRYTSNNLMSFWANFAKYGYPGKSSNSINWKPYYSDRDKKFSYLVLDNKKNLRMEYGFESFESLAINLHKEKGVNNLEKCVILLQMFTFVGNDIYEENIKDYPGSCNRRLSENFLKENASFIEY